MAEVVGAVASAAQLIQLSGALLAGGYGFLHRVARAPTEIRSLLTETAAVNSLLGQIQAVAENDPQATPNDALQALDRLGIFQECHSTLLLIQKALDTCDKMHGHDVRNFGRRLVWPFKEKETKDAMQRLHHLRELLTNALEVNSAMSLRRIETYQGLLLEEVKSLSAGDKTRTNDAEDRAFVSWLCPLPSDGAYASLDNALNRRLPGTGTWFLESDTFKDWSQSTSSTIWLTGLPGSGKTILCSSIIERIQSIRTPATALLFFFCDHRDTQKRTLEHFLMNIIKQICDQSPECLQRAKTLYEEKKSMDRPFNKAEYPSLIENLVGYFKDVVFVVDGLDEASEIQSISHHLIQFHSHLGRRGIPSRLIFSSRFDIRIEKFFGPISSIRIALADNTRLDIESYIKTELEARVHRGDLKLRDKSLLASIKDRVKQQAGTLLQARLQLEYISTTKTDRDLKVMLANLPNGLDYTYEKILCQAAARYPDRVGEIKKLLQCLVTAASPLSPSQLSEIMALQPGVPFLDIDAVPTDAYDALEVISPLVVIDREEADQETVKLCHYSLKEYLCSEQIQGGPAAIFFIDPGNADAWLTSICLQYLTISKFYNFDGVESYTKVSKLQETYTFLPYASWNWLTHMARSSNLDSSMRPFQPYLDMFLEGSEGSSSYRLAQIVVPKKCVTDGSCFHSPICLAISAGIDSLIEYLLPHVPSIDHHFDDGFTCLTAAARWGNAQVASKLLRLGADVNITCDGPTGRGSTPLHLAAEFGHILAFDVLLNAGADCHARSHSLSTPFYRAARGGNTYILKKLKEYGCDINARTYDNWSPLIEAIEWEREDVVELLIEWGADLSVVTDRGDSPLSTAKDIGNETIYKIIAAAMTRVDPLENDVEVDLKTGM